MIRLDLANWSFSGVPTVKSTVDKESSKEPEPVAGQKHARDDGEKEPTSDGGPPAKKIEH